ncbi:JmjC domain [Dillenia turbinata]|uniref:Bifunctional lysine-specific demethylase and histidyl-hydroxylase n=1 Tax=Dillenia turbinata TaxID=194707 RepID=A0AAN8ZD74_9MAGN
MGFFDDYLNFHGRCAEFSSLCAEIVGAASLLSIEINEVIAADGEIIGGLLSASMSSDRAVSVAACNALLDLSTTSIGRNKLLEFSALETLICKFLQVSESSTKFISGCMMSKGNDCCYKIGFIGDELVLLLLDAAIVLVNACNFGQLERIPWKLSEAFLTFLRELWTYVHFQHLGCVGNVCQCDQYEDFHWSSIKTHDLAETIFRLSIKASQIAIPAFTSDMVKREIFDTRHSSFEDFLFDHWEISPLLIKRPSKATNQRNVPFSSFLQSLDYNNQVLLISSLVKNMVSCLPIASGQLDIFRFLMEIRNQLGCPMIYGQDIRVVKTSNHLKRELHFFQESSGPFCGSAPHVLHYEDIIACERAFKEGYTTAIRGMEFRSKSIASVAEELAALFGQPSSGVNMYLTPPNSQGLACHYDDHCVFVCQILGTKQWKISSKPMVQLPRLYEPRQSLHNLEVEMSEGDGKQIFLREGDVLYIPRGFTHVACTAADNGGENDLAPFSLHLTLGIEIERPFEWEGFVHVALNAWLQKQKQSHYESNDSLSGILYTACSNLLHVSIQMVGDSDPAFRKACLVAVHTLPDDARAKLDLNNRANFSQLISKIATKGTFFNAIRRIEEAIEKNEDPFHNLRWLQNLGEDGELIGSEAKNPFLVAENYFGLLVECRHSAEQTFTQLKSEFCSAVVFEDVESIYKMLLEKYKKAMECPVFLVCVFLVLKLEKKMNLQLRMM